MKIAITSNGTDLDAPVDPRFGRAKYFLIYDTETKDLQVIENAQNMQAPQGAGIQSGQTVASTGVEAVLTGNCGPKAFSVLGQAGIKVYVHVEGTVRQAIDDLAAGKLQMAGSANVDGHWI